MESQGHLFLLPTTRSALSRNPQLLETVRGIGAAHGMDYLDDAAVARMLYEQRAAVGRLKRGRQREALRQPVLDGYRMVLAAARAHGVAVSYIPGWLVGSEPFSGRHLAPLPPHEPLPEPAPPAPGQLPLPPKPEGAQSYESIVGQGGWHDEVGWLLIIFGLIGTAYAFAQDTPAAYAASLLFVLGVGTLLAGYRLGRTKGRLREHAVAYVQQLIAAQRAGAVIPELSPPLRELVDPAGPPGYGRTDHCPPPYV
jgi:hypothetical protein